MRSGMSTMCRPNRTTSRSERGATLLKATFISIRSYCVRTYVCYECGLDSLCISSIIANSICT